MGHQIFVKKLYCSPISLELPKYWMLCWWKFPPFITTSLAWSMNAELCWSGLNDMDFFLLVGWRDALNEESSWRFISKCPCKGNPCLYAEHFRYYFYLYMAVFLSPFSTENKGDEHRLGTTNGEPEYANASMVGVIKGPQFEFSADIPRQSELVVIGNAAWHSDTDSDWTGRVTRDIQLLCQLAHRY